jgi:hypothetical protein
LEKEENIMQKNASFLTRERDKTWAATKTTSLTRQSAVIGAIIGEIAGAIIGTITGSLTLDLTGALMGFTMGVILGASAGIIVGVVVSKTAGASGGPSIGAYSGMGTGAILGAIIGMFIPNAFRMSPMVLQTRVLDTLASSRFETVAFFAFLFCLLGTAVGVWVAGNNYESAK